MKSRIETKCPSCARDHNGMCDDCRKGLAFVDRHLHRSGDLMAVWESDAYKINAIRYFIKQHSGADIPLSVACVVHVMLELGSM